MQTDHPQLADSQRDPDCLIAFLHVPKTAGTTLNSILSREYAPDECYEIMMRGMAWIPPRAAILRRPLISLSKVFRLRTAVRTRRELRLVHGHFDLSIAKHLPGDTRFFTLLRDPVERAISHYYHYRRRAIDRLHPLAMRSTLKEWVGGCGIVEMDNGQTRRLAGEMNLPFGRVTPAMLERAISRLARFAVVGVTERFDESLILLRRAFGWRVRPASAQNVGENRPPRVDVSEEALEAIERCNRFDRELYRFASDLFEARVSSVNAGKARLVEERVALAG
jgi:Sulfotransferase family.